MPCLPVGLPPAILLPCLRYACWRRLPLLFCSPPLAPLLSCPPAIIDDVFSWPLLMRHAICRLFSLLSMPFQPPCPSGHCLTLLLLRHYVAVHHLLCAHIIINVHRLPAPWRCLLYLLIITIFNIRFERAYYYYYALLEERWLHHAHSLLPYPTTPLFDMRCWLICLLMPVRAHSRDNGALKSAICRPMKTSTAERATLALPLCPDSGDTMPRQTLILLLLR